MVPLAIDDGGRHTSGAHVYGASRYVLDTRGLMLTGCRVQISGLRHAHWPVVQQHDHPGTSDHAIPADWDRRQISQVRAPARHAAGRATSLPPRQSLCGPPGAGFPADG